MRAYLIFLSLYFCIEYNYLSYIQYKIYNIYRINESTIDHLWLLFKNARLAINLLLKYYISGLTTLYYLLCWLLQKKVYNKIHCSFSKWQMTNANNNKFIFNVSFQATLKHKILCKYNIQLLLLIFIIIYCWT